MAAPAVLPHHREIQLLLVGIEGLDRVAPQGRVKAAAGTAAADALPVLGSGHGDATGSFHSLTPDAVFPAQVRRQP